MRRLLALAEPPDAVFAYNDLIAIGAMRAVGEAGLRIPEDIAVIGFDDIEEGRFWAPTLTTISPDKEHIGRLAVRALVARIEGAAGQPAVRRAAALPPGATGEHAGRPAPDHLSGLSGPLLCTRGRGAPHQRARRAAPAGAERRSAPAQRQP